MKHRVSRTPGQYHLDFIDYSRAAVLMVCRTTRGKLYFLASREEQVRAPRRRRLFAARAPRKRAPAHYPADTVPGTSRLKLYITFKLHPTSVSEFPGTYEYPTAVVRTTVRTTRARVD